MEDVQEEIKAAFEEAFPPCDGKYLGGSERLLERTS